MKLEETENLKLQYVTTIQTNSPKLINTQFLDPKLAEKNFKYTKIYEKNPTFKTQRTTF